jgi:Meckel syndrome type 1 protein
MTQTTPPTSDDDLPDERELAALYARLPKVEPDASLDAAVLAEATRAVQVSRRPRWPVALASAAVLVLAVGVAWQVRELQPAPSAIPTAAVPPPVVPAPTAPSAAMPAAADMRAPRTVESIAAEAAPTRDLRKTSPAYVGAASAANVGAASAPNVGAAPAPNVGAAPAANVGAASAAKPAQRAQAYRTAPSISAKVTSAPAPSPQQYEAAAPAPSGMLRENIAAKIATDAIVPGNLGPDDRVGEIRRLLGSGNRAQALRELNDLRRRYPHYDLPQDLRDLNP